MSIDIGYNVPYRGVKTVWRITILTGLDGHANVTYEGKEDEEEEEVSSRGLFMGISTSI
jgi:hypothetical protein